MAKSSPSSISVPLLLLMAFAAGAGTTWLLQHYSGNRSVAPTIESFLPDSTASVTATVASLPTPPDVAQLPPAEGARTLGNWNYDRQNWSRAIEHYEQAIALGADNADVRTDLGNCYRFLGQPEKALEQYEIAQKQNPQHENSLFNQISLFGDLLHNPERAVSAARDFIERFPESPQAEAARRRLSASPIAPK